MGDKTRVISGTSPDKVNLLLCAKKIEYIVYRELDMSPILLLVLLG